MKKPISTNRTADNLLLRGQFHSKLRGVDRGPGADRGGANQLAWRYPETSSKDSREFAILFRIYPASVLTDGVTSFCPGQ